MTAGHRCDIRKTRDLTRPGIATLNLPHAVITPDPDLAARIDTNAMAIAGGDRDYLSRD